MAQQTLSAPLALIKVNGIVIGKMKSIRCTEQYRRSMVVGIGTVLASENPIVGWTGQLTASQFTMDLRKEVFPGSAFRVFQTIQQWEDNILMNTDGIQIDILRKVDAGRLPNGTYAPAKLKVFGSVRAAFLNRESFDISEGQISGRDVEFEYLNPIIFPL